MVQLDDDNIRVLCMFLNSGVIKERRSYVMANQVNSRTPSFCDNTVAAIKESRFIDTMRFYEHAPLLGPKGTLRAPFLQ